MWGEGVYRQLFTPSPRRQAFGGSFVTSVVCLTVGNCTAGLEIMVSQQRPGGGDGEQAVVVDEVNGAWRPAQLVPGIAALNTDLNAEVSSVDCSSPGNCLAGGWYGEAGHQVSFVATEAGGTWGGATQVPGISGLPGFDPGADASVASVSCIRAGGGAGGCTVGGSYGTRAFVASESAGNWTAQPVTDAQGVPLNGARVSAVSCGASAGCTAAGVNTVNGSLHSWALSGGHAQPLTGSPTARVMSTPCRALVATASPAAITGPRPGSRWRSPPMAPAPGTTLTLSAPTGIFSQEQTGQFTVQVSPVLSGTPTGTVTINAGSVALCTITLANGAGRCSRPRRRCSPTAPRPARSSSRAETRPSARSPWTMAGAAAT
jgi:hypothetical protein